MNVAFDGKVLAAGPPTGVARSFLTTLTAYRELVEGRLVVLVPVGARAALDLVPSGCDALEVDASHRARQRQWPAVLAQQGIDLLHAPVAAIPLRSPVPTVATLHDLPWLEAATRSEPAARWRFRLAARWALDRADAVVVPSAATAAAVARWRPKHRARVEVVGHGHPRSSCPPPDPADRRGPFLVLGDDRPRKNLPRVAEAHRRAAACRPGLPPIEFVGPPTRWLGEDEKRARLDDAAALLHFSLLEGFGLPVLEALAHGCPLACSDLPALREVGGDVPLFVDPTDVDAMAAAILTLHGDAGLRRRQAHAGPERARAFTPEAAARAWVALHRTLVEEPTP